VEVAGFRFEGGVRKLAIGPHARSLHDDIAEE
jgi:hypothetical protein